MTLIEKLKIKLTAEERDMVGKPLLKVRSCFVHLSLCY